jgi:hypothetical protein
MLFYHTENVLKNQVRARKRETAELNDDDDGSNSDNGDE